MRLQARRNLGDRKDLPLRDRTLPGAHGKVHIKGAPNVRYCCRVDAGIGHAAVSPSLRPTLAVMRRGPLWTTGAAGVKIERAG